MVEVELHLVRYGRDVLTIFDLFGSKENDMTFSLGWLLSKSEVFLRLFLKDVLGGAQNDVNIHHQTTNWSRL